MIWFSEVGFVFTKLFFILVFRYQLPDIGSWEILCIFWRAKKLCLFGDLITHEIMTKKKTKKIFRVFTFLWFVGF